MIQVDEVLKDLPHFETFCSVEKLYGLVDELKGDPRFSVRQLGASGEGRPIYNVRFGKGSRKALFVAFPHCKEPICSLTVYSLMHQLRAGHPGLCGADVEWNIIPCIDPDGAVLNEGWTQHPVTMKSYMENFYVQPLPDQVDGSFPIDHKRLHWDRPSHEGAILKGVLDEVRPDFFYSLHNAWIGGTFVHLTWDVGPACRQSIYDLHRALDFPIQQRPMWRGVCKEYDVGIVEQWTVRRHYDYLEKSVEAPEEIIRFGSQSWDYLEQIKPEALSLAAELGYVRHPADVSDKETGESLRRFMLRVDADSKYLATVLLEEWEKTKGELDAAHPIYRSIEGGGVLPTRETLLAGGRPMAMQPTEDILFNPQHDRLMREGDRFQACMVEAGFWFLCHSYQFVRLLKQSRQTPAIQSAIARLDAAFDEALRTIDGYIDFGAFEPIPCDQLARVQLGVGLVVLNALLQGQAARAA